MIPAASVDWGPGRLRPILDRTFRLNPCYRLVAHAELPPEHRGTLATLADNPDHFGILLPSPGAGLGVQAVDRDGAALLRVLRTAGQLPAALREACSKTANVSIAVLVMDGVLEIEHDGAFLTGPAASAEVMQTAVERRPPVGRVGRLSDEALRRAERLPFADAGRLRSWLYGFGAIPADPVRAGTLRNDDGFEQLAKIEIGSAAHRELCKSYYRSSSQGWTRWQHRGVQLWHALADDPAAFKLYLSCRPGALPALFPPLIRCLVAHDVPAFKLARGIFGVLRPDKLVLYFNQLPALHAFWKTLAPRITGIAPHGVPFSAPLDEDGVASWGVDPPKSRRIVGWYGSESWRVWVTERLARALSLGRALGAAEPRSYALDRLHAEGIDVETWQPSEAFLAEP